MPELLLVPIELSPAPDDPVQVYLDQLGPGSRASIRSSVRVISSRLAPAGGRVQWERLRYRDVAALRAWLVDTYAPATAARHLQAAIGILREAFRLGLLSADAWMRIREVRAVSVRPRRNGRLIDEADSDRLQRAAGNGAAGCRDAALLWVLLGAGVRRSEAVAADLEDYDRASGVLRVRSVKHGFPRAIPLEDDARAALEAWLEVRGDWPGPLLTAVDQRDRVVRRRLTTSGAYFLLRRSRAARAPGGCGRTTCASPSTGMPSTPTGGRWMSSRRRASLVTAVGSTPATSTTTSAGWVRSSRSPGLHTGQARSVTVPEPAGVLPTLLVQGSTLPGMVLRIELETIEARRAVDAAVNYGGQLLVVPLFGHHDPTRLRVGSVDHSFQVGFIATLLHREVGDSPRAVVRSDRRVRLGRFVRWQPFPLFAGTPVPDIEPAAWDRDPLEVIQLAGQYMRVTDERPPYVVRPGVTVGEAIDWAAACATWADMEVEEVAAAFDLSERIDVVWRRLTDLLEMLEMPENQPETAAGLSTPPPSWWGHLADGRVLPREEEA
jgi:integrase